MNDQPLSNDQASDLGDFTVGNDGCTIIMDQTVNSPTPSSDSPMPSSVRGKRNTIRDLFKGTFFDEFKFEDSPEYSVSLKKMMLNGKDILALRQEDLEKMSLDEAKNLLFQIHFEGNLRKKGFRGLQMWKRRYFRILGSTLIYFDVYTCFHNVVRVFLGHRAERTRDEGNGHVLRDEVSVRFSRDARS